MSPRDLLVPASSALGSEECYYSPGVLFGFNVGAEDLNSGSHAYPESTALTEPSPRFFHPPFLSSVSDKSTFPSRGFFLVPLKRILLVPTHAFYREKYSALRNTLCIFL